MAAGIPRPVRIVTGATQGIGRALVRELSQGPGTVVLVGRDPARVREVSADVARRSGAARIETATADLTLLEETNRLADELGERFPVVDALVNNAGAYFARRETTPEGHERTWALNVLAPFLLTHRLLPRIDPHAGRIVNVASAAHLGRRLELDDLEGEQSFRGFRQYGRSKLALILLTYEFAARLGAHGITVNALHPGFVRSGFAQNNGGGTALAIRLAARVFGISPERGARTPLFLVTSPTVAAVSGAYFVRGRPARSSAASYDGPTGEALWSACCRATGLPVDVLPRGSPPAAS